MDLSTFDRSSTPVGWLGGWFGSHGVPAPPVRTRAFPYCEAVSPVLAPSTARQTCSRAVGHTGRHAAYAFTETLAVWA